MQHAVELVGRSGVGMEGLAPLSYLTLIGYIQLTGWTFEPWEVSALMQLDAVLRNPPELDGNKPMVKADVEVPDAPVKPTKRKRK